MKNLTEGECPKVSVNQDSVIILGIDNTDLQQVSNSSIAMICHQIKHLFLDGDCHGEKGIEHCRKTGKPIINQAVRISISYTFSAYRQGDQSGVTINFMYSNTPQPYAIMKCDSSLSDAARSNILAQYEACDEFCSPDILAVKRPLTHTEALNYQHLCAEICREEIERHLKTVYHMARIIGHTPDYLATASIY